MAVIYSNDKLSRFDSYKHFQSMPVREEVLLYLTGNNVLETNALAYYGPKMFHRIFPWSGLATSLQAKQLVR